MSMFDLLFAVSLVSYVSVVYCRLMTNLDRMRVEQSWLEIRVIVATYWLVLVSSLNSLKKNLSLRKLNSATTNWCPTKKNELNLVYGWAFFNQLIHYVYFYFFVGSLF